MATNLSSRLDRVLAQGSTDSVGNLPPTEPRRDGWAQSDVWEIPHRENLCRDVANRERVDSLVLKDVRRQPEGRTSKDAGLCGGHDSTARGDLRNGTSPRKCSRSDPPTSKDPAQEQGRTGPNDDDCHNRDHDRDGRSMGCHGPSDSSGHHAQPTTRDDRCSAKPGPQHGECDGRDPEPCAPCQPDSPVDRILNAGDWSKDFDVDYNQTHNMNSRHKKFHELVNQFTKELQEVSKWEGLRQRPKLQVLEVFCSSTSELTRQVNKLGYRASRHGIQEGDLSLTEGRRRLFQTALEERPQHIWFSPTCGPWCAWSVFNESQSAAGFQHVQEQRDKHLFQLALGLVLYRFQCIHQRHLHWEQPARSLMLKMPYLYEVSQGTYAAQFDMCKVGELKDPQNQKLIKKGMQINTTSQQLYFHFNGRKCNHQHEHQTLEGSTIYRGERVQRTAFSENYTRKFARSIAQVLTKVKNMKELPVICWDDTALALQGIKRSTNADPNMRAKRAKLQNSSLIEPQEMPAKRRRIHEKSQDSMSNQSLCESICSQVTAIAPKSRTKNNRGYQDS